MTLAVLVILGTVCAWLTILAVRWATVKPVSSELSQRSIFVAAEFGGALAGAAFPTLWVVCSNLTTWISTGRAGFVFTGHLPPGVDEDDLLMVLIVGMMILVSRGFARFYSYVIDEKPEE